MYWQAWGPVRGNCGHKHRSRDTAARCAERDDRRVKRLMYWQAWGPVRGIPLSRLIRLLTRRPEGYRPRRESP